MNIVPEIVEYLRSFNPFSFKFGDTYFSEGTCPGCGRKSLFTSVEKPFVIKCNHENSCGYAENIRDAIPELFEDISKRYPATPENRNASADVYLAMNRGFDLSKIHNWYEQASCPPENGGTPLTTVRFYIDDGRTRYWERIIDRTNGKKAHFGGQRKKDGTLYQGDVWSPPGMALELGDECFITEGIFDAISLYSAGYKAVASFSAQHYPNDFIEAHKYKNIQFTFTLDSDHAGKANMLKHYKRLKSDGYLATICIPPYGKDWNDLWQSGSLTQSAINNGKYLGRLHRAETVAEKALYYYQRNQRTAFILDFENSLYFLKLSAGEEFNKKLSVIEEDLRESELQLKLPVENDTDQALKEAGSNEDEDKENTSDKAPEPKPIPKDEPNYRNRALNTPEGREIFNTYLDITQISNVWPRFLYMERNEIMDEQFYVFSIDYANGQGQDIIKLDGSDITTPSSFHQALLNRSRGGTFDGSVPNLKTMRNWWLNSKILTVGAVPYIGYVKDLQAYIYPQNAWHQGRKLKINKQGFFNIKKQGIKSSLQGLVFNTEGDFKPNWLDDFISAFHYQGLATLAFFLGSLFSQQIRELHKSFPFLEFTGEPGAGKSTVLEFLWKCLGRDDYEGFDLLKSTVAGRRRAFSQVSNLPVVLIESDRETGEHDAKQRVFSFEEFKPFYNGRGTGTLGVARRGNETDESLFQGALLISQNAEVDGSEALLQRIVHCHADKRHHKPGSREKARWFERQTSDTVGGFLHAALSKEKDILARFSEAFKDFEKNYSEKGLKNERIIKNHAQIAACGSALTLIFPSLSEQKIKELGDYLLHRAFERERRISADHPALEAFWDAFDYINTKASRGTTLEEQLNHSRVFDQQLALNLNHFREACQNFGQAYPDMQLLRKLLPGTKRYHFIESNRAVHSRLWDRTVRCWVFNKK